MELIRHNYIRLLEENIDTPNIKILTGLRRVGKSTILKQFINFLINDKKIMKDQILVFDFNNKILSEEFDWKSLVEFIKNKIEANKKYYLFIDEIQEIDNFGKALITLFEDKTINLDIYVTGSNSKTLSTELSSSFSGRHRDINVWPISFKEFKTLLHSNNLNELLDKYLEFGGMGKIIPFINNGSQIKIELKTIFQDCVNRDIKERYIIKKMNLFNAVCDYVYSVIGNKFSIKNIINYIKSATKQKYSLNTIYSYLQYLENANLIKKVNFYNVKGKKMLNSACKYYSGDLGLLAYKNNFSKLNKSWKIENLVYLQLLNNYDEVYTYAERGKEIDFICTKNGVLTYFQVTTNLLEKNEPNSNWNREIGNLELIKDSNRKVLLSLNSNTTTLPNGIQIINLLDWLLE